MPPARSSSLPCEGYSVTLKPTPRLEHQVIDSLGLRNFRCFQDTDELALKPLTLLIGENSTGKTSFLAATRLAWDLSFSGSQLNFNEEPFLLGAYDQIAHYRGGRAGRATTFDIASSVAVRPPRRENQPPSARISMKFNTTFRQEGSHPVIQRQSVEYAGFTLTADFHGQEGIPRVQMSSTSRTIDLPLKEGTRTYRFTPESPMEWGFLAFLFARLEAARDSVPSNKPKLTDLELTVLEEIGRHTRMARSRPIALAPVRTRPLRTYNPVSATPLPEGAHIPMVLAKTYFENEDRWKALREALHQFGTESGLFDELDIKSLGRSESEPFQLRIKIDGPPANLVDVGYGVSQVLPILVDSILADRGETYLLQQPEVHLHPRAQAALGSFLVRMTVEQGKRFVVETHSDYLIDRVRTDIRDSKRATPDDVSLLFFRRSGIQVDIHPMQLDEAGNLSNVPDDYRAFFLNEERRLLGV
jgi:hypothetical protein